MVKSGTFTSMLHEEVMTEMAESFFSARKGVDDEIDLFESKEADVALAGQRALCRCALLHTLLLGTEGSRGFFDALGVDIAPSGLLAKVAPVIPCLFMPLPWGISMKSRYTSLLVRVYSSVYAAFDMYLNGSCYTYLCENKKETSLVSENYQAGSGGFDDVAGFGAGEVDTPGYSAFSLSGKSRRTGRTVGWNRYVSWCAEINARIEVVNRNHAPSQVLGMARLMDVGVVTQERATGTGVDGLDSSMDVSLCLRPIACHLAGVGDLPALPEPEKVRSLVEDYAKYFYARNDKAVKAEIVRLQRMQPCSASGCAEL